MNISYLDFNLNGYLFSYRWFVPITFKTNKGVHEKVLWFDDTTDSVTITEKDVKWLKLNNDQVGYYRVNYPLEMWQSLIEQLKLKSDQLTISDRAHLLNDVFALAEAGVVPYELALNLTTYLPVEEDYVPWRTAASILISLSDRLSESISVKMQTYIQQLVSNIYSKQNWDNNNLIVIDRLLRTAIIDLGARVGLPAAEEKIRVIFQGWINSHSTSQMQMNNTDLRDIVLYYGMKYASHSEWDKLWQMYKNENDAQIQATLLKALTASRNIEILKKYLTLAWDESNVRNQDYLQLLGTFSVNPWGLELVWTYVREHWTQLVNRFTLNDNFLGVMVRTITKNFDTEVRLQEMESFFQQYPEAGAGAAERARALETVRNNIEWAAARAPQITAWLDRYTTESAYLSIKTRPHSCCINPVIGYRLPRHVAPTNYKLRMWPNATSKTFRGTVEIALSIYNPTNNVTLHTNKLVIESVNLENFFFEKISRDQFLHHMHIALSEDVRLSSHPIVQTVDTPKQVMAMFDEVSYKKGASLIRMLEGFTGEQNFAKGVSDYLTKHKFGNADRQDLLASLEPYFKIEYPDLNLTYVMDTWTKQAGYPLLTVTKEANTYFITQSRFLLDPKTVLPKDSIFNYRWCIPITFKSDKGVNEKVVWFDDQTDSVVVTDANVNWLKLNNNQYGYYRVNYPLELWQSLIELLETKSNQLTISDRAHLLNDVFALAEAGVVPYELALKLTTYLPVEEDYVPWRTAASILNRLSDRLINTLAYDKMQAYIRHLVVPIYKKQKWEVSPLGVIERLLRTDILTLSTRAGLPAAEQNVRDIFLGWLNSHRKPVEKDLRDLVYYYGMKYASQAEWDKLWQIYNEEDDLQEQEKIRKALAAPRNTEILKKYLILAWDEVKISHQDFLMVLTYIAENPSGTALAWDFVRGRWPKLVSRYTLGDPLLASILPRITSSFSTELKLREMESFFQQYPEAGAGAAARARALENIRNNIEWIATRAPQLAAWLKTPLNELLI
ncbi:hypothetical protein MSG28_006266 [Choristoneura fumiferana]|uniref:Uncharacterized protein n=1 Tax=Choristoneura fumiferana TaxID=7141 RepID=A0ACC0JE90_CHOFU|nr:hypothetical protein MSG28_006266 [Choristoneura fumiferana]